MKLNQAQQAYFQPYSIIEECFYSLNLIKSDFEIQHIRQIKCLAERCWKMLKYLRQVEINNVDIFIM